MTDEGLRCWAVAHPHMPQAVAVLRLLGKKAEKNHVRAGDANR